jgi:hypothetical protein
VPRSFFRWWQSWHDRGTFRSAKPHTPAEWCKKAARHSGVKLRRLLTDLETRCRGGHALYSGRLMCCWLDGVPRCRHRAMTPKKDCGTLFILRARYPGPRCHHVTTFGRVGRTAAAPPAPSLFFLSHISQKMVTCWHHLDQPNETVPPSFLGWWQTWHDRGTRAVSVLRHVCPDRRSLGPHYHSWLTQSAALALTYSCD